MRVLIATDAWHPQVNGVVRTYERLQTEAGKLGTEINFVTPTEYFSLPCPTYPEIRLAVLGTRSIEMRVKAFDPDFIHIATEGPIGFMARRFCHKVMRPFTTCYHTRFPEYVAARFPIGETWGYAYQRRFHNSGAGMMVAAPSLADELLAKGFQNILPWTRGVDLEAFKPQPVRLFGENIPVFIYVGRVAIEKNLKAFLDLDLPGRKVVVGDGPQLPELRRRYPSVIFTGPKEGEDLAEHYASADVFVFPSLTDTFGIVLIEAMASGLPIAAFPVTGPKDIVKVGRNGILSTNLREAALQALKLSKKTCREEAMNFSWQKVAQQFLENIERSAIPLTKKHRIVQ